MNRNELVNFFCEVRKEAAKYINTNGFNIKIEEGGTYNRRKCLHPSSIAKCPRQIFFDNNITIKSEPDCFSSRIFTTGHFSHAKFAYENIVASYLINSKIVKFDRVKEFNIICGDKENGTKVFDSNIIKDNEIIDYKEINISLPEYNLYGHCDMVAQIILDNDDSFYFVIENKTTNDKNFNWIGGDTYSKYSEEWQKYNDISMTASKPLETGRFKMPSGPDIHYYYQAQLYSYMLIQNYNLDVRYAIIMYENKNNSNLLYYCLPYNINLFDMNDIYSFINRIIYIYTTIYVKHECPDRIHYTDEHIEETESKLRDCASNDKKFYKKCILCNNSKNRTELVMDKTVKYIKCKCGHIDMSFECLYCNWSKICSSIKLMQYISGLSYDMTEYSIYNAYISKVILFTICPVQFNIFKTILL